MNATETEPTRNLRFIGAVVAFIIFACLLAAVLVALDAGGASQATVLFVGKALTYSVFGVILVGWKWPQAILGPFKRLFVSLASAGDISAGSTQNEVWPHQRGLRKHLRSPLQRALFSAACLGLVPWMVMRLIRELWRSSGTSDYLRSVFVEPLSPWFESGWWWYTKLAWYDWPVLPSLAGVCLAFAWPHTGARLVAWVRGT
jgi:hypothetical protein